MDATQFIKEHGIKKAREVVDGAPANARYFETYPLRVRYYISDIGCNRAISISELKRLVESVDLVEHFGNDLVGAKQLLEFSKDCKTIELSGSVITIERLEQAITDYDSIYSDKEMGDDSHIENHISKSCKVIDYD